MTQKLSSDMAIVGAGPAGLAAAEEAASHGLRVIVLDEFPEPGGRLLGQFHEEKGLWWIGKRVAEQRIERCAALGVELRCGVSVHGILAAGGRWTLRTSHGAVTSPRVLLATGGAEVPRPIPGWTLPGVMSIGAAQVLTNVHYVKPGRRGLIIGVNALALAIARELSVSGVSIAGIVLPAEGWLSGNDASPKQTVRKLLGLAHMAPFPMMRIGGRAARALGMAGLVSRLFPRKGVKLWDIPLKLRTAALSINGKENVESVTLADVNGQGRTIAGSEREEPVDFAALAGGLYPLAELASVAGCPLVYEEALGGYIPLHSEAMRTPLEGLYVAGNITGVEGALVAMAQGKVAALSACRDAGLLAGRGDAMLDEAMRQVRQARAGALIQFHPGIAAARERLYGRTALKQAP